MCLIQRTNPQGLIAKALREFPRSVAIERSKALPIPAGNAARRPSNSDFANYLGSVARDMEELVDLLVSGQISPRGWGDRFKVLMNDGHAGSWIFGRQRAGDLVGARVEDYLIGVGYADAQADFLLSFIKDLENGRYDGEAGALKRSPVATRARLYVQTMRGTSGASFVAVSDPLEEFNWVMGAVEHCPDCPQLAAFSPWDQSTLYAFPGDGSTACLGNCKCHIERASDGLTSFKPVTLT